MVIPEGNYTCTINANPYNLTEIEENCKHKYSTVKSK